MQFYPAPSQTKRLFSDVRYAAAASRRMPLMRCFW
jgi:hypothetical protein